MAVILSKGLGLHFRAVTLAGARRRVEGTQGALFQSDVARQEHVRSVSTDAVEVGHRIATLRRRLGPSQVAFARRRPRMAWAQPPIVRPPAPRGPTGVGWSQA